MESFKPYQRAKNTMEHAVNGDNSYKWFTRNVFEKLGLFWNNNNNDNKL